MFDKVSKNQFRYTPEGVLGSSSVNNVSKLGDGGDVSPDEDAVLFEENWVSNDSQHASGDDSAGKMTGRSMDVDVNTVSFVWLANYYLSP